MGIVVYPIWKYDVVRQNPHICFVSRSVTISEGAHVNPYRLAPPPRWWAPKLNPFLIRLARPIRRRRRVREQWLEQVEVTGLEHVRKAVDAGQGVLITPNHPTHADAFSMYEAADQLGHPFFFMATWHVFDSRTRIGQWALQRHGVFSVDREGADLQAFKQAVKVVQDEPYPLVIFPEGEVYHCNDRVTPFREGAAAIALSAAKRSKRDVVCIPCALKYEYVEDPMQRLVAVMDELERQIHWRPRSDLPLTDRIYQFGEAVMALKEMEFLGRANSGTLVERTDVLANEILGRLERRHQLEPQHATIPERVKELRRRSIGALAKLDGAHSDRKQLDDDLDDLFLVVQLFSYPGDYVAEKPSVERLAETLDKFEEDLLGQYSASIRARRKVTVSFGEAVPVPSDRSGKDAPHRLTETLEQRVQQMLDQHGTSNS